ncbi:MAG: hydrogenase maturation nickel metallochaperone HypA [Candidatus Eremiobacter antarcticus]|nr:hydrogenase maturation nickel metallochaperone HypA [Candidatus Eremiobacteraeota bacterium]MBC5808763.1 hydrogenase maturation nickel metallochaperone HypA [Candidatus Eremiobacteraeota bacterium]PZR61738.1 MAG: hydrogenase maturation nickel metallochaperone HypA [Candidatus Eremiobacter sp. RRmetagenome_bin22]
MHEISIALSLLEGLSEEAERRRIGRVSAVRVRIGVMSAVVKDSLLFAWDLAAAGTIAEGSELKIEEVPLALWCSKCDCERAPTFPTSFQCSVCGTFATEIRHGRELDIVAMEVPDDIPAG